MSETAPLAWHGRYTEALDWHLFKQVVSIVSERGTQLPSGQRVVYGRSDLAKHSCSPNAVTEVGMGKCHVSAEGPWKTIRCYLIYVVFLRCYCWPCIQHCNYSPCFCWWIIPISSHCKSPVFLFLSMFVALKSSNLFGVPTAFPSHLGLFGPPGAGRGWSKGGEGHRLQGHFGEWGGDRDSVVKAQKYYKSSY